MIVKNVNYEENNNRYIVEFEDKGINWFRYFPKDIEVWALHDWLNSLIKDVKIRS